MSVVKIDTTIANDRINDDLIQPFQLEVSSLRGRLVRLGPVLDKILNAHDYPNSVARLVTETITLSLVLSSMLKYEGIFTLQSSSDGPVSMLVTDVTTKGHVRACASFDKDRIQDTAEKDLLGKGHLAFTVDQGMHTERYQGIVSIENGSLEESIQHYFSQSEQIGTGLRMAVQAPEEGAKTGWRAGAIMLQHLPEHGEHLDHKQRKDISFKEDSTDMEEDWRRANILLDTCTAEEFLAPALDGNELLVRLFHEEGVRVYTPTHVIKKCRCSRERIEGILKTLSEEELQESAEKSKIEICCEFCNEQYLFKLDDILGARDA